MNGKPVLFRDAKTVLTTNADKFREKQLCDGLTLNLGDACALGCAYCYVGAQMLRVVKPDLVAHGETTGRKVGPADVVIRRQNAIGILRSQLVRPDGSAIHADPDDRRIIFASTLVDVAANRELLEETAEACLLILRHTNWHIRLLSKSSLLKELITGPLIPPEYHHRLILGFSIGTLDDKVARAIERHASSPSARVKAHRELQDLGVRTFGMLCPSLPQEDYGRASRELCDAIRADRCEHVWAEVINVRRDSLARTLGTLRNAGLDAEAERLQAVSGTGRQAAWEDYARRTFLAHTGNIPPDKLRFLQYVSQATAPWWSARRGEGAICFGGQAAPPEPAAPGEAGAAGNTGVIAAECVPLPALTSADTAYRDEREALVTAAVRSGIAAAKALHEIHAYRDGIL